MHQENPSRKRIKPIILIFLLALLSGCDKNVVFEQNINFKNQQWHRDSIKTFIAEIGDTVSSFNIYINCRITGLYPNSNLFLFVNTKGPKGLIIRDTMECILANDRGKWLGKGFGDVWSNRIPFKQKIRFPARGIYSFEIEQAMRQRELNSILDVGIRIEKYNPR